MASSRANAERTEAETEFGAAAPVLAPYHGGSCRRQMGANEAKAVAYHKLRSRRALNMTGPSASGRSRRMRAVETPQPPSAAGSSEAVVGRVVADQDQFRLAGIARGLRSRDPVDRLLLNDAEVEEARTGGAFPSVRQPRSCPVRPVPAQVAVGLTVSCLDGDRRRCRELPSAPRDAPGDSKTSRRATDHPSASSRLNVTAETGSLPRRATIESGSPSLA